MFMNFRMAQECQLSTQEYKFLKEFEESIAQTDLNADPLQLAHMLVKKMVLYRKKKMVILLCKKKNEKDKLQYSRSQVS